MKLKRAKQRPIASTFLDQALTVRLHPNMVASSVRVAAARVVQRLSLRTTSSTVLAIRLLGHLSCVGAAVY